MNTKCLKKLRAAGSVVDGTDSPVKDKTMEQPRYDTPCKAGSPVAYQVILSLV